MQRILIIGSDHLGLRVLEQLCAGGARVTLVAPPDSWLAGAPLPESVERVVARPDARDVIERAGAREVDALVAATDRDELNLGVALAALDLNPNVRVVLRQFNLRLGRLVARELPRARVLSMSALAAPTFALAALTPGVRAVFTVGEARLVIRTLDAGRLAAETGGAAGRAVSIVASSSSTHGETLAGGGESSRASSVDTLVASGEDALPPHPRRIERPRRAPRRFDWHAYRLTFGALAALAFVVVASATFFQLRLGVGALDAYYFVVTTITSVGFGDYNLRDADALSKFVGMGVMASGVMTTAILFAFVTNNLLARQAFADKGHVRRKSRDHVVVCGLGVIGFRVAQALRQRGTPVVVIERDEDGRFVDQARAEGISVIVGDALHEKTLAYANLERARAIVVCTNPDYLNIEIALHARAYAESIPVVVRVFDPELSRRIADHFRLEAAFSSASLVAPEFASAATGSTRLGSVAFAGQAIDFHLVEIDRRETIADYARRTGRVPIAVVEGARLRCALAPDDVLDAGVRLVEARRGEGGTGPAAAAANPDAPSVSP